MTATMTDLDELMTIFMHMREELKIIEEIVNRIKYREFQKNFQDAEID